MDAREEVAVNGLRVTVTGATGLIGPALVAGLREQGAEVTVLSRDPQRASALLNSSLAPVQAPPVEAIGWDPLSEPAPERALHARDAILHLAGESVAQRWSSAARRAIRDSRVSGTRNLLAGLARVERPPRTLVSSSAVGYYGAHGEEPLDEDAPPGVDFLADVCKTWEAEAARASALGARVVLVRTGVVLDRRGGALAKMLVPFRLGVGGPVASGRQYISWIHVEDQIGMMLAALADERWSGPINATAPQPVCNRDFSRALGRVLRRPALLPVPGAALRLRYGRMADILTHGARVVPAKALVLGYRFSHPELEPALRSVLGAG
jgi:uncharacterized protein (TIGR01777 family)